jgi:hypothetical protein
MESTSVQVNVEGSGFHQKAGIECDDLKRDKTGEN